MREHSNAARPPRPTPSRSPVASASRSACCSSSIDFYTKGHGRWLGIALFAVLIAVGYLALGLLPRETHPAAVTMIVAGVPGAIGWWLLPHAHRFADVRPFIILTIVVWAAMLVRPAHARTHDLRRRGVAPLLALDDR